MPVHEDIPSVLVADYGAPGFAIRTCLCSTKPSARLAFTPTKYDSESAFAVPEHM